jgi:hypothetical protein
MAGMITVGVDGSEPSLLAVRWAVGRSQGRAPVPARPVARRRCGPATVLIMDDAWIRQGTERSRPGYPTAWMASSTAWTVFLPAGLVGSVNHLPLTRSWKIGW